MLGNRTQWRQDGRHRRIHCALAAPLKIYTFLQEENLMSSKEARKVHADSQKKRNMSEWFSLFADLDPLANPDAIGISTKESDPNCYS